MNRCMQWVTHIFCWGQECIQMTLGCIRHFYVDVNIQDSTQITITSPLTLFRNAGALHWWTLHPLSTLPTVMGKGLGHGKALSCPLGKVVRLVFFLYLPLLLPPWTVAWRTVFDRPWALVTWPYHCSFLFLMVSAALHSSCTWWWLHAQPY